MTQLYDPRDEWNAPDELAVPALELLDLATRLRDGKSLTEAERAEVAAVLARVASARRIWDGFPENYPAADTAERAHHMRGVLGFVLRRELR